MSTDLARFMQSFLSPLTLESTRWAPAMDVYRLADGWLLKFDLAGVRPGDIELTARGRRLVVRGRRRDWVVEESRGCSTYSMEIMYSQFERAVELPCEVEQMKITTEYRDGMLLVRLHTEGCEG